jgi:hypothetical protein
MILRLAFLTILMILALPLTAGANSISAETANLYYEKCMSINDTRMTEKAQDGLCSCVAARLPVIMTVPDLNTMNPDPKHPGRPAYNKMIQHVYAPCMQHPIEDKLIGECLSDSKITAFALRDPVALCTCMAEKTGKFLANDSGNIIADILRRAPGLTDPYEAILGDSGFRQKAYDNLYACLPMGN